MRRRSGLLTALASGFVRATSTARATSLIRARRVLVASGVALASGLALAAGPTPSAAAASWAPTAVTRAASSVWSSPLGGTSPVVLRPYRPPAQRWLAGNRGVDLAASPGAVVLAPTAGTVTFAGVVGGVPVVVVRARSGWRATLEPVQARVGVGTAVRRGQAIGTLADGVPWCAPASCLHWGVVTGRGHAARYRDPMPLLSGRPPVLLPWLPAS